jgi:hypothetical protein
VTDQWPSLPLAQWDKTKDTLHMWSQVVGKVRLASAPLVNHWWNVVLYVSARGLTTSAMPHGKRVFEIEFDFIDHRLVIRTGEGQTRSIPLYARSVADFYAEVMKTLEELDLSVRIWSMPVEVSDPIPFEKDVQHASYDAEAVGRFWRILVNTQHVFEEFRSRFIGKSSPVHFFWGSFDLAVTRFSGRRAPERPGADPITREAYSHEVISHGFWPGGGTLLEPAFYAYASPAPAGLSEAKIRPDNAGYLKEMSEFILRYDHVRAAESPEADLMEFLESTYEAGADLAKWDRASLERR